MPFQPHYVSIEGAESIQGGTAVVLDVLRAYTTAAWAFALGASRIVLSDDLDEALALKARIPGALALKDAEPMPGFELSNSPVELQSHDLRGVTIVQKTTAGTVGAVAARRAEHLYCASFLTAAATASAIMRTRADEVYFVVTGEAGAADEDQACAEYIAALLGHYKPPLDLPPLPPNVGRLVKLDDEPFLQRVAHSNAARVIAERIANAVPGIHPGDVEAAMDVNRFDFVMQAREEHIDGAGPSLVLRAYNQWDD